MNEKRLIATDKFVHHVGRHRLRSLFKALWDSYQETYTILRKRWPGKVGIALRPQIQHANVQDALLNVAERYADQAFAGKLVPNKNESEWHTEITAGPVTLTDAYLPSIEHSPRKAYYRDSLAESNMGSLFEAQALEVSTPLYALLIHGFDDTTAAERLKRKRPDFAQIVFPKEDATSLANISIDLMTMFPDVVRAGRTGEEIADAAMPEIREQTYGDEG